MSLGEGFGGGFRWVVGGVFFFADLVADCFSTLSHFCDIKCPEKPPGKSPAKIIQQKSPTIVCRGARPTSVGPLLCCIASAFTLSELMLLDSLVLPRSRKKKQPTWIDQPRGSFPDSGGRPGLRT